MRNRVFHLRGSHRAIAAMCAGLVLALAIFAASPTAHQWLHAEAESHGCPEHPKSKPIAAGEDRGCVITLFATGIEGAVAAIPVAAPRLTARGNAPVAAEDFYLVSPRYLRQPERGPPSSLVV